MKWLRVLPPQATQAARAFVDDQSGKIRALPVIGGRARYPLLKRGRQHDLGLSPADSWTQPAHDLDPIVVAIEVGLGSKTKLIARPQQFNGVQRKIDVRSRRGIDAEKLRRCNAHHSEGQI